MKRENGQNPENPANKKRIGIIYLLI